MDYMEYIGSTVVNEIVTYVSGVLQDEANLLAGVEESVNSLIGELRLINIFLTNSEGKRNDKSGKEVVRQVKEVAYEAEDVIDSFIYKVAEHRRRSKPGRIVHFPSHVMMLRHVGKKVKVIKERIEKLYKKESIDIGRVEATVNAFEEEAIHRRRREVDEDDVVGFIADIRILVQQLTGGSLMRDVISIIGMAGLGKTTLACQIYNIIRGRSHFDFHAWVNVSLNFKTRDLLLKILKQMQTPDELRRKLVSMSEDELKKELFKFLQDKRYLIVMDDIWRTEVWDDIGSVFPNNCNGSRILITSRNKEVALHASNTPPYYLPPLNKDESWELLSKKVFRQETCPPELETFGRQIAESCHGLPLSIVVLAGLLANKEKSPHIWKIFVRDVTSFLITREDDTTICQKILSLSYDDLPRRLKPCFLYFGIFPEDFEIPVRRLMHLWVAEGFIQLAEPRILSEDVAEIYLEELIDRSLIQVVSRRTDGGAKTCRIHDLLRELCILESAEEMFLEVQSENHLVTNKSRRLSIHGSSASRYMSVNPSVPTNARSLFFFASTSNDHTTWTWVQKHFKFLRVLNFEKLGIPVVPKSIATLIHLRYLTIQFHHPSVFPISVGNLTNLQTLCFKDNLCEGCLPKEIFKLQRLKNLYLPRGLLLPCDSKEALVNLRVLSIATIKYDAQKRGFPIVLDKFPNVRKLKMLIEGSLNEMPEAEVIVSFPRLHLLASLEVLRIEKCGMLLGNLNPIPSSITKLTLVGVALKVDGCMTVLEKLPQLLILKLEEDHHLSDISMHVIADSFLQLQVLKLRDLRIEEWKLERRAMPRLRHLVIERCDKFTSPPELLSLTTLRYVEVIHCPRLATMLRELQTDIGFKLLIKD